MKDFTYKLTSWFTNCIETKKGEGDITYHLGCVGTDHGFVHVYSQGGWACTRMQFIRNGRVHERTFDKTFTSRGLVTKAKQFAEEVCK